ncbi:MAG TPA: thiamine pyrophosphate-binding protein [Candidatus Dormibacteraeota bacterium]|nr:thiamine pyrophosphate-binding protein [Candidatus Dormibacteraeota bacterium]
MSDGGVKAVRVKPTSKGGAYIADFLVQQKVPYVFGVCGHGILGLLDGLFDRRDEIKAISVHHESAAGFMAEAYFRITQKPAATYTSCGPGSANLILAIAAAFSDSSAMLNITGNVPTGQWNRGPFQETGRYFQGDFVNVLRPYVKRSFQPTRADMLPLALRQAFALMTNGRPGPVHIDVPLNVFVEPVDEKAADRDKDWPLTEYSRPVASPAAVEQALRLLRGAERPVIVAGHGVELSNAEPELLAFAEAFRIPVATTPFGKGVFDPRHPLSLGTTGRNGSYPANAACRNADVILALGTRFDDRATSAWLPGFTYNIPPSKLIHVDIDPTEIGRNFRPEMGIVSDAKLMLQQLLAAPSAAIHHDAWLERIAGWRKRWEAAVVPPRTSDAIPIRPERAVADLRRVVPEDGIVLCDVGLHHNWLVAEYEAWKPRTFLQTWGFASMGFAVAGSVGAKLAAPDKPVVALCGDGAFMMNNTAVLTAVEYQIPVVWVVWNNIGYCSIRNQQSGYFGKGREIAVSFTDPSGNLFSADYAMLARSMGAEGHTVEKAADLAPQLEAAIRSGRPTVLDVRIDRETPMLATGSWDLPPLPHPMPNFGWGED